jgi:hypothetical protein
LQATSPDFKPQSHHGKPKNKKERKKKKKRKTKLQRCECKVGRNRATASATTSTAHLLAVWSMEILKKFDVMNNMENKS